VSTFKPRDVLDLVLLGAIWGASFLFMRVAAPEFGPVPLIATRVAIAAVFLLVILAARGGVRHLYPHAWPLTVLGAISSAVPFSLFAYAVLSLTAGFTSVLNATVPLFGALVAYVWLGDTLGRFRALGLVVGFAGVLLLVLEKDSFARGGSGWAVLAALSASLLYGVGASYTKKALASVDPLVNATGSQIAATAFLLLPALIYWPGTNPSRVSWASAIGLGVVCTGVALILFFRLIARVGPAKAITVTYLIPAFGVLWGFLVLHEPVNASMLAGCAVILLGTGLATGLLRPKPVAVASLGHVER
jgi:drug/metabolite transporter (DMT)-like permease